MVYNPSDALMKAQAKIEAIDRRRIGDAVQGRPGAAPTIRAALAVSHELATKAESLASRLCGHPYDMAMPVGDRTPAPLLDELRDEAGDLASHVGRAMAALDAIEKAIQ